MIRLLDPRSAGLQLLVALAVSASGAAAQSTPSVVVGIRPLSVRQGETFIATVRVTAPRLPDLIDFDPGPGARVLRESDATSTGIGTGGGVVRILERTFELEALVPGRLAMPDVLVAFGGDVVATPLPVVTVAAAPLDWGAPARGRAEPVPNRGAPARPRVDDRVGDPIGAAGVPPAVPGSTYDIDLGAYGWARDAAADPWWEEMVPELLAYQGFAEDGEGLAALETGITPEQAFVGQQLTLVTAVTFPPGAEYLMPRLPQVANPFMADALMVDLPVGAGLPVARLGLGMEAHVFLRAYFPLSPGMRRLEPTRLDYRAPSGDARWLTASPFPVDVRPIPVADAPEGWTGAVGRYRISAWTTRDATVVGNPVLLIVDVAGAGHVPSLPRPDPGPVWQAGLRPLSERAWLEVRDGVIGGVKRFTWVVVPAEGAEVRIGPIVYPYFDPYLGGFDAAASEEIVLGVAERLP